MYIYHPKLGPNLCEVGIYLYTYIWDHSLFLRCENEARLWGRDPVQLCEGLSGAVRACKTFSGIVDALARFCELL
jgi:hypothetical protein